MDPQIVSEKVNIATEAEVRNRLIAECIHNVHNYLRSRTWETFTNKFKSMSIKLPPDLIACKMCEEEMTGHYFEREKKIIVCANHTTDEEMENTLTHEMIHLYDDARAEVDFYSPAHIACSEIRATNLSGECKQNTIFKQSKSDKKYTACVKERAIKSLVSNRHVNVSRMEADDIVMNVWDVCYYDYEPFTMDEAKRRLGKKV